MKNKDSVAGFASLFLILLREFLFLGVWFYKVHITFVRSTFKHLVINNLNCFLSPNNHFFSYAILYDLILPGIIYLPNLCCI